ncbi:MAG: ATP-dependent zinc protease [Flammeovirgaceae bacterium]|nr:ATP-dependent zinc protease [Flammeovirgaceae bacterium]MBE61768.1 ATP-dependent zinc protease [Flammeovirgaceae bacterium]MBR08840.1 ATP-dependent zinc protease [Rickettsiales bacterium]HCX22583.1 ATP-dependent zinc protease [Cytophagales bacterium]|tara:strand:+ start:161 stop:592 length:432 start_codon:yes stop_codon:yes gene_type:complete
MREKKVIGRSDKVDLPDLGIMEANAKVDTGAYTSSIHCKKIKINEGILSFQLPTEIEGKSVVKKFQTRDYYQKSIKSSNGESQKRYIIKTHIVIFGKSYLAEFSLSDRSLMKNPILLGRKLLKDRFLVDVSKKNLSADQKKTS